MTTTRPPPPPPPLPKDIPYTRAERGIHIKLAMDVAQKGYRPKIPEEWNPALSILITSCWSQDASMRPSLGLVMSGLGVILSSDNVKITDKSAPLVRPTSQAVDTDIAPGELWRRVECPYNAVKLAKVLGHAKVLGQGSFATVYECTFQGKKCAFKLFRNTEEEKAFREIEMTFSLRHPHIIGLYGWSQDKRSAISQIGMIIELASGGWFLGVVGLGG